MRSTRQMVSRARSLMGLHRYRDLAGRVDELAVSARENEHLDRLLSDRVEKLEQVTATLAEKRLARRGTTTREE